MGLSTERDTGRATGTVVGGYDLRDGWGSKLISLFGWVLLLTHFGCLG